jgi:hypothetical protein
MGNLAVFLALCAIIALSILVGSFTSGSAKERSNSRGAMVPHIGRIEVRNGCGVDGVAWKAADFLRLRGFDVKNDGIGNAPAFNYDKTLVVARTKDMAIPNQIAKALGLSPDRVIMVRDGEQQFDVSVYIGSDYQEYIK